MSERDPGRPIYHAATAADWATRTTTHYRPAGYAEEGFVHCSAADQLVDTLNLRFAGRGDLILLTIDPVVLGSEVVWEDLYGGGVDFPHVYGPVELAAVTAVTPLEPAGDGRFDRWRPDPDSGPGPDPEPDGNPGSP